MLLALTFSGCFENNEDQKPTQDLLFNKIKNNVIDFVNNVSSYKYIKTGGVKNFLIEGSSTEISEIVSNTTFKADINNQSLELITNYTNIGLKLDYKFYLGN